MFRYCFVCLFLISSLSVSAATRTIIVPPGGITPTYGPGVGGDAFIDSRDWQATVSDQPNSRVKVPVVNARSYGWPKYRAALKNALKVNPASVVTSAAAAAAVAAAGYVLDPDNNTIQRREESFNGEPVANSESGYHPVAICERLPASKTLEKVTILRHSGATYAVMVSRNLPDSYNYAPNNCTNMNLGYYPAPVTGFWPRSGAVFISDSDITETKVPLVDADYDSFTGAMSDPGQAAEIAPGIEAAVPGSFDYPDSQTFGGPDSIELPRTETTTLDNVSGNTTVTETIPSYDFDYGTDPLSITTTTTTVTNTYVDGVQTSTSTTTTSGPAVDAPAQSGELTFPEIPTDCDFMPTVCEFITWFKTPTDMPEPDLPTPEDQDFERSYSASFGGGCPAPRTISLDNFDSVSFSWEPLCTFAGYLRFLVIGGASLMAAYIGLGISRGNA